MTLPNPTAAQKLGFLTIGPNVFFDLSSISTSIIPFNPKKSIFAASILGSFRDSTGAKFGDGLLTAQLPKGATSGSTSYSVSITATAVPTPALLPGVIGLGMGILRKRKQEMAAANAEA